MTSAMAAQNFPSVFREWRAFRKLSQLDLALAADVSQRHVSWLETGRSQPSREMVVRLSEAMQVPLRERNVLLQAAGFAPMYRESDLDEPAMKPVYDALSQMLKHHDPLPAIVVDRFWNVKMKNQAADLMLSLGGDIEAMQASIGTNSDEINLALLTVHPEGMRPFISNWDQAAPLFIQRLKREADGDPDIRDRMAAIIELAGPMPDIALQAEGLLPVLPLELNVNGLELSLFSVMSTFGTPMDITTDELRIESFYPADTATEAFFKSMSA
ncbi:helix-turn-helix transcriptional regulator [Maricurvus nonylphenolicus]|uniref:helix-turn-helix domain-containing protein n=1 Tax=Maricurvus nonylphenolicus TaxID=1008307 RepID=UPI0036F28F29